MTPSHTYEVFLKADGKSEFRSAVTEPNRHKGHRQNDGKLVAEHRRQLREGS